MPTLTGTTHSPSTLRSPLTQMDLVGEENKKAIAALDEEVGLWHRYMNTRDGQIIHDLATPYIEKLQRDLNESVSDIMRRTGLSMDAVNELRAEWRGSLLVWQTILMKPKYLERMLSDMKSALEAQKNRVKRGSPVSRPSPKKNS